MSNGSFNSTRREVLSNEAAKRAYYDQVTEQRAEALKRNAAEVEQKEQRLMETTLYRRTQYTPPHLRKLATCATSAAEAWIEEHPGPRPEDAATRGELQQLIYLERTRLKAVRRILKELGIK